MPAFKGSIGKKKTEEPDPKEIRLEAKKPDFGISIPGKMYGFGGSKNTGKTTSVKDYMCPLRSEVKCPKSEVSNVICCECTIPDRRIPL